MALPKRRHSHSRTRMRRAHDGLTSAKSGKCPQCGSPKMPHTICGYCGYYRGVEVLAMVKEQSETDTDAGKSS